MVYVDIWICSGCFLVLSSEKIDSCSESSWFCIWVHLSNIHASLGINRSARAPGGPGWLWLCALRQCQHRVCLRPSRRVWCPCGPVVSPGRINVDRRPQQWWCARVFSWKGAAVYVGCIAAFQCGTRDCADTGECRVLLNRHVGGVSAGWKCWHFTNSDGHSVDHIHARTNAHTGGTPDGPPKHAPAVGRCVRNFPFVCVLMLPNCFTYGFYVGSSKNQSLEINSHTLLFYVCLAWRCTVCTFLQDKYKNRIFTKITYAYAGSPVQFAHGINPRFTTRNRTTRRKCSYRRSCFLSNQTWCKCCLLSSSWQFQH